MTMLLFIRIRCRGVENVDDSIFCGVVVAVFDLMELTVGKKSKIGVVVDEVVVVEVEHYCFHKVKKAKEKQTEKLFQKSSHC